VWPRRLAVARDDVNTTPATSELAETQLDCQTNVVFQPRACALRNMESTGCKQTLLASALLVSLVDAVYDRGRRQQYKHFRLYYFRLYAVT